jgi:tellurite resistance protein
MPSPQHYTEILKAVHSEKLSPEDAETIMEIAQLVVDADGQEDQDEIESFFAIGKAIYALAGIAETPTPTFASDLEDDERIKGLANELESTSVKELAYCVAYILAVSDIALAPEEDAYVEKLRIALGMTEDRADELAAQMGAAITPPA